MESSGPGKRSLGGVNPSSRKAGENGSTLPRTRERLLSAGAEEAREGPKAPMGESSVRKPVEKGNEPLRRKKGGGGGLATCRGPHAEKYPLLSFRARKPVKAGQGENRSALFFTQAHAERLPAGGEVSPTQSRWQSNSLFNLSRNSLSRRNSQELSAPQLLPV